MGENHNMNVNQDNSKLFISSILNELFENSMNEYDVVSRDYVKGYRKALMDVMDRMEMECDSKTFTIQN